MTDLVVVEEIQILTQEVDDQVLTEVVDSVVIVTEAEQGPPGPRGLQGLPGDAVTVTVGATPLSGHSAVALDANGLLVPADCTDPAQRGAVMGLVANAYSPGEQAAVLLSYTLEHAGWAWTPGPVFVGTGGVLAQALPPGAVFSQVVAHALSATRLLIDLQPPIALS